METIREELVAKMVQGEQTISELCREYRISRPTAYKWLERYKSGGGFSDKSHEPLFKPNKTSAEQEEIILTTRLEHPTWGARKLRRYLTDKGIYELPAASTISDILKRNGCISPEDSEAHTPYIHFEKEKPNELWQMDFKGHFKMLNNERCHPLTILDDHSRFSLCVDAKENECWDGVNSSLIRVFNEYGLPRAILADNGHPWRQSMDGYTYYDVWMMQIDILPIHGRPMHPQTQGKEERFHRTLKDDLLNRKVIENIHHAQNEFDLFRYVYNFERPHNALKLDTPAKHYHESSIAMPERIKEPIYDESRRLRKVNCKGYISINKDKYYLSESFSGKYLELLDEPQDCISLCYGNFKIAKIDLNERLFISRKIYRR